LGSIPAGWVGLDAGTGNGKYLDLVLPRAWLIGLDRSANLLSYARGTADMPPREVVRGDVLANAWRVGVFVGVFLLIRERGIG
jgi:tRNA (uracil-5-)-methyltransferase TRM9